MPEDPKCKDCRYHCAVSDECRRHAPKAFAVGAELMSGWPGANEDDWCGEHVPKA
jgi:hypothetical protein